MNTATRRPPTGLYDDMLRRSVSEYSGQARAWVSASIIYREERDALEIVHRRLLADEDHWINSPVNPRPMINDLRSTMPRSTSR